MRSVLIIVTLVLLAVLSLTYWEQLSAQHTGIPAQAPYQIVVVAEGLHHPWSIAFVPGGDFLVTERRGVLWRITPEGRKSKIEGLPPLYAEDQAGLFDLVLDPAFEQTGNVYFSYVAPADGPNNTELARARLNLAHNRLEDVRVLFQAMPKLEGSKHYGGRILFAPDGTLFLTLAERYDHKEEAQNTVNHLGTIVHLNKDGTPAANNPFLQQEGARPEIYTYGNRNIQGVAIQPATKLIWFHEHGPRGGDEVNILKAGANYGWPAITYGIGYMGETISDKTSLPGMEQPVVQWTPSIAPSGMTFYSGKRFPAWEGNLFVGALAGRHLRRLEVKDQTITRQEVLLEELGARIRDVREGPDGYLYLVTDSARGQLLRLEPLKDSPHP